jgi:hypothetical protein
MLAVAIEAWRDKPNLVMAALGLISGLLSAVVGFDLQLELKPFSNLFFLDSQMLPTGFFFGLVVAAGLWLWTRNIWTLPVLLVTTMYAWSAAVQVAIRIQNNAGSNFRLILASLAAGAVGAGITHLGCALFARELRRPWHIALTTIAGALAGLLFFLGERNILDERLLFIIWQPVVAYCIGSALMARSDIA